MGCEGYRVEARDGKRGVLKKYLSKGGVRDGTNEIEGK